MLLYGDVEHDSRVRREAGSLVEAGFDVTIVTLAAPGAERRPFVLSEGARVLPVRPSSSSVRPGATSPFLATAARRSASSRRTPRTARLRVAVDRVRWIAGYVWTYLSWMRAVERAAPRADVWHGHDLLGLFVADRLRASRGGKLVYDSHELYLEAGSAARLPRLARLALARLERSAARHADGVITVNVSIARELRRRYGVEAEVVMNCPRLQDPVTDHRLRDAYALGDRPVVMYHGALSPDRGVEQIVEARAALPDRTAIVLLGDGPLAGRYEEGRRTEHEAELFIHPAVPVDELRHWVADADVGVIAFQPVDRNNVLGTPNKLFEYFESGVPVVVSDFPEMRRIVEETGAGTVCDPQDVPALARAIVELLGAAPGDKARRRSAARLAAVTSYNWAAQSQILLRIYERLTPSATLAEARGAG